ncbi:MAG TPA: hypothetical protein VG015_06010 [Candidatus Dormibacteraeota bacterium]|nr:hypothetical protein [Candidatus Dormibacteraeota bacterium]
MGTRRAQIRRKAEQSLSFAPNDVTRIRVQPVLGQWAVTVYRMPDCQVLTEDYFDSFDLAKARAEDFGRLLKDRELAA